MKKKYRNFYSKLKNRIRVFGNYLVFAKINAKWVSVLKKIRYIAIQTDLQNFTEKVEADKIC